MTDDYFKISGTGETLLHFKDLLWVQKDGKVQGFNTEWDEVLLSMTKVPEEEKLENALKTPLVLRDIKTSHGIVLAGYGARTGQLFSIERNGSPSCRSEHKGQQFQ